MSRRLTVLVALIAGIGVARPEIAAACGACFAPPEATTQVTDHRMVLSLSPRRTTLWDQIVYRGAPESFAWVLPVSGEVEIGVGSSAIFRTLDAVTIPVVAPPATTCAQNCETTKVDFTSGSSGNGVGEGVTVLGEQVVGPYEVVRVRSGDPNALSAWLSSHGFVVPPDVAPIVDSYVAAGSDFVCLKLVPGAGVTAMRPVRVSMPGAVPTLPLRMIAAGAGARVGLTLFVVGETYYQPRDAPTWAMRGEDLVWNWATRTSNYLDVRTARADADPGAWQLESKVDGRVDVLGNFLRSNAADPPGAPPEDRETAEADVAALFSRLGAPGEDPARMVLITRLRAKPDRAALDRDLVLVPADDPLPMGRTLTAGAAIGEEPCRRCERRPGGVVVARGCSTTSVSDDFPWAVVSATLAVITLITFRRRRLLRRRAKGSA